MYLYKGSHIMYTRNFLRFNYSKDLLDAETAKSILNILTQVDIKNSKNVVNDVLTSLNNHIDDTNNPHHDRMRITYKEFIESFYNTYFNFCKYVLNLTTIMSLDEFKSATKDDVNLLILLCNYKTSSVAIDDLKGSDITNVMRRSLIGQIPDKNKYTTKTIFPFYKSSLTINDPLITKYGLYKHSDNSYSKYTGGSLYRDHEVIGIHSFMDIKNLYNFSMILGCDKNYTTASTLSDVGSTVIGFSRFLSLYTMNRNIFTNEPIVFTDRSLTHSSFNERVLFDRFELTFQSVCVSNSSNELASLGMAPNVKYLVVGIRKTEVYDSVSVINESDVVLNITDSTSTNTKLYNTHPCIPQPSEAQVKYFVCKTNVNRVYIGFKDNTINLIFVYEDYGFDTYTLSCQFTPFTDNGVLKADGTCMYFYNTNKTDDVQWCNRNTTTQYSTYMSDVILFNNQLPDDMLPLALSSII